VHARAPSGRVATTGRVDTCGRRYQTWPPVNFPLPPDRLPPLGSPRTDQRCDTTRRDATRYDTTIASRFMRLVVAYLLASPRQPLAAIAIAIAIFDRSIDRAKFYDSAPSNRAHARLRITRVSSESALNAADSRSSDLSLCLYLSLYVYRLSLSLFPPLSLSLSLSLALSLSLLAEIVRTKTAIDVNKRNIPVGVPLRA